VEAASSRSSIESIIASLENAPGLIVPLIREVPPERRKRRPATTRWSAHEHACHLAEVESLFAARLDLLIEEDHPKIVPYNPPAAEDDAALLKMDLEESMERLGSLRQKNVARLRALPPEAWERTAEHPEYARYSIRIMARHFALHDLLHAYRIEEILLAR